MNKLLFFKDIPLGYQTSLCQECVRLLVLRMTQAHKPGGHLTFRIHGIADSDSSSAS